MIYKKIPSNSTSKSIWIGGNKEFYEDHQSVANKARHYLLIIYMAGMTALQAFVQSQDTIDPRIIPVYRKFEIEEILSMHPLLTNSEEVEIMVYHHVQVSPNKKVHTQIKYKQSKIFSSRN